MMDLRDHVCPVTKPMFFLQYAVSLHLLFFTSISLLVPFESENLGIVLEETYRSFIFHLLRDLQKRRVRKTKVEEKEETIKNNSGFAKASCYAMPQS